MAKRKIDTAVIKSVEKFIAEVSKHYKVDAAFLFGSYAKGIQHKDSDIDVAIVSSDIKNQFDEIAKLYKYSRGIDLRIEPHPIKTDEYQKITTPFIDEIIRTGIPILV